MKGAPYPYIVCCVDRSEPSRVVEARAVALARGLGAQLRMLHVMRPARSFAGGVTARSKPTATLEGELRGEAAAWLLKHAGVEDGAELTLLEAALPGEAICEWAERHPVSVLVAGQCEKRYPRALGSTATYLSMHAPCDVLLVDASGGDVAEAV
ncbi:MAG: universal stress protein [Thermoleophilia bacterium]|nr:universal stress protein [Thermoleophilia bacterium]MDH3725653.1 universal stress protein [Thermoleophilia bacterium]